MTGRLNRVIVCQIGAREHYAVPRTLYRAGLLDELITDVWVPPNVGLRHMPARVGERLRGRYHSNLSDASVTHFTRAALSREVMRVATGRNSRWDALIAQNRWFQAKVVRHLRARRIFEGTSEKPIVLAYSYAALEILALAHDAGARTILAQIDGGDAEEALVTALCSNRSEIMRDTAPSTYWSDWRKECRIADRIFVNSQWSRELLIRAGVDGGKLVIAPVVYDPGPSRALAAHQYPKAFDATRPLKILFLGTLAIRKGVLETLEAARALAHRPVHFIFAGGDPEDRASLMLGQPNITRHGRVPRNRVLEFYRDADVFLFPTHSDGFGMTQIEALESGLPVIASRNCAAVVEHGKTGLLLETVSTGAIVRAISTCLDHPERLAAMSVSALAAGAAFANHGATALLDAMQDISALESQ